MEEKYEQLTLNIEEEIEDDWNTEPTEEVEEELTGTIDDYLYKDYGIFKLSPRECGRLMGVRDDEIDRMAAVNSNTQLLKQFGNGIVVPVIMALMSQLNIKGVKPWNDMTQEEREKFIERRTKKHDTAI